MNASFLQFLTTGELGRIRIGTKAAAVQIELGSPPAVAAFGRSTRIFKYGRVQIHVSDDEVGLIAIHFHAALPSSDGAVLFVDWLPEPDEARAAFQSRLSDAGIGWHIDAAMSESSQTTVVCGNGRVAAIFDEDRLQRVLACKPIPSRRGVRQHMR